MNHIGLFEGFGGFALAAQRMNWKTIAWCEINPFCQKILQYYWSNATGHYDIKDTDFTIYKGKCDILTGGFPCQPYSSGGSRKGKEDARHLWPEMLRAVREIQPPWIVGENVSGLYNWNGGLVFEEIQADLENEGYEVQPIFLPAISVGADHIRERIWFIAYSSSLGRCNVEDYKRASFNEVGNTKRRRTKTAWWDKETNELDPSCNTFLRFERMFGKSPVFSMDDGLSTGLDGIAFQDWQRESLKGAGNAVVPQLVFEIFQVIEKMNLEMKYKSYSYCA